jgi:hypothetical protein
MRQQDHKLSQPPAAAETYARYALWLITLVICICGMRASGQAGLSRLLSEFGSTKDSLAATEEALRYEAADPDAHYAYALHLAEGGRSSEALVEFERATELRPADYFLWQELGRARDESGDSQGAIAALGRAIELAPAYSQPHWQLGNLLLRDNKRPEAFREMRLAVATDPALFPLMADLAWGVCDGDPLNRARFALSMAQPADDRQRVSLAGLFVRQGQIEAALSLMRTTHNVAEEDRRSLVASLIGSGNISAAYQVWSSNSPGGNAEDDVVFDGGFEKPISSTSNLQSFGWQPTQATQTVHLLSDPNESHSGKLSLQIEYAGNFAPQVPVISELVPVFSGTRYRVHFFARTENLLSAALPIVAVREIGTDGRAIAQSLQLPSGTTGWREFSVDFETTAGTTGVTINIQRQTCTVSPCPIVGRAWFDEFSLSRE